jgi:hypothetical protein
MNMRPYIGVESGTQLDPELSRLIGSAMFNDDAIVTSWVADSAFSAFCVGRWTLDVGRFFSSFIGTSFIPHFGHVPGASVTTSGCITQVYFCTAGSAVTRVAPTVAIAATIINKNSLFILVPEN